MKKRFSLFSVIALVAILGISPVSAQKTTLTVEKLWSITEPGSGAARQGFGMDGALYYHQQGVGVYRVTGADASPELVISKESSGIGAHAVAKDDAGNIVLFGSAIFPTSDTTKNFIYVQKKGETAGVQIASPTLEGFNRTDFIFASGDVFSEEGGCLYLINNNGRAGFQIDITNGANATVRQLDTYNMALGGYQNTVMCVHDDGDFCYASAGYGIYAAEGYSYSSRISLPDLNTQCLGATHFTIAGKELWVYHVGNNYTSQFKIINVTDNSFVADKSGSMEFVINNISKTSGGALRGVWTNVEKIDDNNYMLYAWHSHDGGAVYKVSAATAAEVTLAVNDDAMGTVEGAGDIAIGTNATVRAYPYMGYSFVCWKDGDEVISTDAEYTFLVTKNIALTAVFQAEENITLTLAINDLNKGYIALSGGIKLGENTVAYGETVTLTATPSNENFYTFVGWYNGDTLYAIDSTIELVVTEDLSLTAKFVDVLNLVYELNGGITNDYGWTSKGDLLLDLQEDIAPYFSYYIFYSDFVKEENGIYYFKINDQWVRESDAQGQSAIVEGFFQNQTYSSDQVVSRILEANVEKYGFLIDLIDFFKNTALQSRDSIKNVSDGEADGQLRSDISGFMLCSPPTESYPYTCDWTICGLPESYVPVWKHAFSNPTEIRTTITLNAPYREGYAFIGWYATPDFSGEKITVVTPESAIDGGTLYAKWEESSKATLTLSAKQPEMGVVIGSVVTYVNTCVKFQANANYGYEFVQWTDGVIDNPRAIVLTQDTTFTAEFAERKVHISTNIDMWEWGTTQGDTAVAAGETVTLTAIPNEGYQFTHWYTYDMYGNYQEYYENPLVIQADRFDQVFTAAFLAPQYALSVNYDPAQCNVYWHNNMYGWGGYFNYSGEQIWVDANSEIMLSVEPFDGCTFEKWNDGKIDNPRYITLSADTTFTAEFAARQVTISTGSNDWGWGTTKGDTVCFSGDSITLIATPYPGYYLAYWETYDIYGTYQQYYGDTISILAASYDQYFTAWFEPIRYALTIDYDPAKCNIHWYNHSTGEGNILNYGEQIWSWENSSIELWVEPLDGYTFAGWSDGNNENPRYFTMEAHDTIVPSPKLLGVCGYNLYWDYTYGMLDIMGDGDMYDYTTWTLPWQQYAHQIYSISLPDGMTSVGASAFADCRFLESVTIPATVREIRYSAFENNRMLSTVNFAAESALTTIGNWAFYNCHELKNITIPEGVTEIGYAAFYGCTYMSELSLPESMQYIADNGFALCSKLRRMNVAASTPPTVAARTFEDVDRSIPVYVPTESVGRYKAAPVWKEFNIVGRDNAPTSVENTEVNSSNVQKIFRDGQVLILRDGKTYSVIGQEVE